DREIDRGGAGVERVLNQFLHDGRWAFDDLARGDLVGDRAGQNGNACGCDEGERHREKLPVRRTKRQLPPICAASITSSDTRSDASSQPSRPSSSTPLVQAPWRPVTRTTSPMIAVAPRSPPSSGSLRSDA